MAEWDALSDLKRNGSKRGSLQTEIDEMKRFMDENELGEGHAKFLRLMLGNAEKAHPQGQKAAGNPEGAQNGQKKSPEVIVIDDDDDDDADADADLPLLEYEPLTRFHDEEAGGSNPVPKRPIPAQPNLKSKTKKPRKSNKGVKKDQKKIQIEVNGHEDDEKNKTLEIRIKLDGQKAGTSNPVSKQAASSQLTKTKKYREVVIMIPDDDEDED